MRQAQTDPADDEQSSTRAQDGFESDEGFGTPTRDEPTTFEPPADRRAPATA